MNILITGSLGFVGGHLREYLLNLNEDNLKLFCTYLPTDLSHGMIPSSQEYVEFIPCDFTRPSDTERVLIKTKPDLIFHLAGLAFVPQAEQDPLLAYQVNSIAIHFLLDAAAKVSPHAKIILISTSEVYGKVSEQDLPLSESSPIKPQNVYATSKVLMEQIAKYFVNRYHLNVIILRPFNHIGPRQSDRFVIANFCKQIARIKLKLHEPVLEVGNLEPQRDFIDVRDIVKAYWLAAAKGMNGEIYNICSGRMLSIRQVTDLMIEISGCAIEIRLDQKRFRNSEIPLLVGNCDKFFHATGWKPSYDIKNTLKETLEYWLNQEKI